jgi:Uma2 family endonuclease
MSAIAAAQPKDLVFDWFSERRWTTPEYLLFANDQNALIELSNGKVVIHAMPTPQHQMIVLNLAARLREYRPGRVLIAPVPVQLWPGKLREPDVMLYRTEHVNRIGEQWAGVPDLVVEVLSPSTRAIDLGEKMDEYAQAGISEYWIVEPDAQNISVYALEGDRYRLAARWRPTEQLHSGLLPDFSLAVDAVFQL